MKQFEAKVQNSCFKKEIIYLLLQIYINLFCFPEHQPNASAPDGVGGWHLQVKHSP
jgi:hypothetical protein